MRAEEAAAGSVVVVAPMDSGIAVGHGGSMVVEERPHSGSRYRMARTALS